MITEAIVKFLVSILNGVLGLFPSYSPDFQGFGSGLGGALAGANSVFPVTVLGLCIVSVIGLRVFLLGLTLVTWVWDKIPFTFK